MPKPSDLMTADEVLLVTRHLRGKTTLNGRLNLAIWWLATGAGLRAGEICRVRIRDFCLEGQRPVINVRAAASKSKHNHQVPLYWNRELLPDLRDWLLFRVEQMDALASDCFVCGVSRRNWGRRLTRHQANRKWLTAIKPLPSHRRQQLHIHCGRHTFASHALQSGRSLIQVARALGHANVSTTNTYLHLIEDDTLPSIYIFDRSA